MKANEAPVVVEQTFNATPADVWDAITRPERMREWYFDNIPSFEPVAGFETQFNVNSEGREFLHLWTVVEVVPREKIAYRWRFEQYPGEGYVTFELKESGGQTTLKVTNEVLEDFDDGIPEFRRESCVEGWEYFIQGNLKDYLEKPRGSQAGQTS